MSMICGDDFDDDDEPESPGTAYDIAKVKGNWKSKGDGSPGWSLTKKTLTFDEDGKFSSAKSTLFRFEGTYKISGSNVTLKITNSADNNYKTGSTKSLTLSNNQLIDSAEKTTYVRS